MYGEYCRKISALTTFPNGNVRSGFKSSCRFTRLETTAELLTQVLRYQTCEPFWKFFANNVHHQMPLPMELR